MADLRADAMRIYHAALEAADPRAAVLNKLTRDGDALRISSGVEYDLSRGRIVVVGAGKAGAPMAQAIEEVLGDKTQVGVVTVKYGYTAMCEKIKLHEAGHPLPDENGLLATRAIVDSLHGLNEDDLVICLISGGGSALLELPVEGVTLDDLRSLTGAVLRSGATINEMNVLRKHLSQVKGGGLARLAQPAQVLSLILSDVLGSPLDVIASGPTAPDSSTFSDAVAVIDKYDLRGQLPSSIMKHLKAGVQGDIPETPKANDRSFKRVTNVIVADNLIACQAAVDEARLLGYDSRLLSDRVQGEAREVGRELGNRARELADAPPGIISLGERLNCLVAGGETTVTVRGDGKGGRCQELALAAAREIAGLPAAVILAAGTDGTDGPTDAAGALADGSSIARARERGMDPDQFLMNNDSYHFFHALGDLVISGATNTNVNDLMLVLVDDRRPHRILDMARDR